MKSRRLMALGPHAEDRTLAHHWAREDVAHRRNISPSMSQMGHFRPTPLPFDVCSSPKAIYLLRGNEMTRMGWTGRAPAPNGSQSAWGACQKQEHRHASQVHGSRSHHHRNRHGEEHTS